MLEKGWCLLFLVWFPLSPLQEVQAGGGSGLLVGLAKDGKIGSGADDWDILIICIAVGAIIIFGSALIHYLWKRHKKQKAAAIMNKEQQIEAGAVGSGRNITKVNATSPSPPPSYNKCIADLEDE